MKITAILLILSAGFSITTRASGSENERAGEIFKSLCMSCHKVERSAAQIAPPIFAMKDHYLRQHPDRAAFIDAVTSWLIEPNAEKSLMPGALRKFKLMPKPAISAAEARQVATFLFDLNLNEPDWYQAHFKQDHPEQQ